MLGSSNAPNFHYTNSVIEYSSAKMLPEVRALKNDLDNVETHRVPGVKPGTVNLILGSTFTSLKTATTGKPPDRHPDQDVRRHHRQGPTSARTTRPSPAPTAADKHS